MAEAKDFKFGAHTLYKDYYPQLHDARAGFVTLLKITIKEL